MKGIVYGLYSIDNDEIFYVGSTIYFKKRIRQHKSNILNEKNIGYNLPVYKYIRENLNNIYTIKIIEKKEIVEKKDILIYEQFWYSFLKKLDCNLKNEKNPIIDMENRKKNNKKYQDSDKGKIIRKEWKKNNKEIIKERDKKYRENNKEIIREKEKERVKKNIDRYKCEICGYHNCDKSKYTRHCNSEKHKKNLH